MTIAPTEIEDAVVAALTPALAGLPFRVEAYGDDARSYIASRMAAVEATLLDGNTRCEFEWK